MFCTKCGKQNLESAQFCTNCGNSLNGSASAHAEPQSGKAGTRDQTSTRDFVYPKNPPLSPHICWLSLLIVGLGQLIFGQVAKAITIMIAAFIVGVLTSGVSFFVMAPLAAFDAYRVGAALRNGRAVGKWQFFP